MAVTAAAAIIAPGITAVAIAADTTVAVTGPATTMGPSDRLLRRPYGYGVRYAGSGYYDGGYSDVGYGDVGYDDGGYTDVG